MADAIVELHQVVKTYGHGPTATEVLHGIDLQVAPGEMTALIGPSGSGKSTLLNLLGLLDRPTSGQVVIAGQDTTTLDDRALTRLRGRTLGFIFQFHHLLPAFSVSENVLMPSFIDQGYITAPMRQRADELLEAVGLAGLAARQASDISGGQQQRVAIARALMLNPPVVLADEPTGNLDTTVADEVFDLFRRINHDDATALIIVTHDPRLADRCDRIVRIVDGLIVEDSRGASQGPCRACGYGPCLRDSCMRASDIPRPATVAESNARGPSPAPAWRRAATQA